MLKQQNIWKYRIQRFTLLVTAFVLGPISSFSLSAYELIDLGVGVRPQDINNQLTVVGSHSNSQSTASAFRWTYDGGIEDLAVGTIANAVNDNEQIVGNSLTGAFLIDGTTISEWDEFSAYGVNEIGSISGNKTMQNIYRPRSLPLAPAVYDGYDWAAYNITNVYSRGRRKGVYADIYELQDVNNSGLAVGHKGRTGLTGSSAILIDSNGAINDSTDITYLPIENGGTASAINNHNMIVGTTASNNRTNTYAYAYLFDGIDVHNLGTLNGGLTSTASDINDEMEVVGSSWLVSELTSINDPTEQHAFIWDKFNGMLDLNELVNAPDWTLTSATAINAHGDIVGVGIVNGEEHGFLLTTN